MITPEDFLRLAERLVQENTEADWRTAISRAYYAVFHTGRLLLEDLRFRVPRGGMAHAYVWMRLSNCGDQAIVLAGGELNHMQGTRNRADYDFQRDFDRSDAQLVVQTARTLMTTIRTGLAQPIRSQITAAIRDYERNVLRAVTWQGP